MTIEYTTKGIKINNKLYLLEEIEDNVRKKQIEEKELVLLEIYWEETRGCDEIYESLVLNKNDAEFVKNSLMNKTIYFGEICGKHSEVYGELEENEIKIITDIDKILDFLKINPNGYDYNHSFIDVFIDHEEENTNLTESEVERLMKIIGTY